MYLEISHEIFIDNIQKRVIQEWLSLEEWTRARENCQLKIRANNYKSFEFAKR